MNEMIVKTYDDAEKAATAMSASGFFSDTRSAAQAIVKILAGQELGFGPFASMTGVSIIQGKPTLGANLMAAAIKRTGKYNYRIVELTDTACELAFLEAGQEVGRSRFTLEDARKAGLDSKDNWKKYPRNMLFARAISNGQRWYAPDIFNGQTVYTPDELGAVTNEDGNVIDAVISEVKQSEQKPAEVANTWPAELVEALVTDGICEVKKHAESALKLLDCEGLSNEDAYKRVNLYRGWRNLDYSKADAQAKAILGEVPQS